MSGLEGCASINTHLIDLNCRYIITDKGIRQLCKKFQRIHKLQQWDHIKKCQKI
jgi:hypothetical protein